MYEYIFTAALGVFLCIIGAVNMTGNVRALHRYHYHRVTPENMIPFGRLVGIGNIVIGIAFMLFSLLMALEFEIVASAVMILGLVIGLGFAFYAMIKYNKGIF
jgi:hypothetical protein